MPIKPIATLKTYFETGDQPTEAQFEDLIDSFIHQQTGLVVTGKTIVSGVVTITFSDASTLVFDVSNNTSEPISFITGLQAALDNKVDKVAGKELSENDFTNTLKTKLDGLANYVPPTNEPISFITGLQAALDLKANDSDVVKSVNSINPDGNGNVVINIPPAGITPTFENFTPTLVDKGGGATYTFTVSKARIYQVGKLTFINIYLTDIETTGTPTGGLAIQSIPKSPEYNTGCIVNQFKGGDVNYYSISGEILGSEIKLVYQSTLDPDFTNFISAVTITSGWLSVSAVFEEN